MVVQLRRGRAEHLEAAGVGGPCVDLVVPGAGRRRRCQLAAGWWVGAGCSGNEGLCVLMRQEP